MSKRTAIEVKIVEFFSTAPLESASSVLEICRNVIKRRGEDVQQPVAKVTRRRRTRKALGGSPVDPSVTTGDV